MKHVFICLLVFAVNSVLADGSLDAVQNTSYNKLVMAVRDDGVLFTYTLKRWQAADEPCPGAGPWDIDLLCTGNGIFDILCLDSTGGLYRATEDSWITLANSFQDDGSD